MERIWTSELHTHVGERVELRGWMHRTRSLGSISFLILRDRTGLAQIVVNDPGQVRLLDGLHSESVLAVEGTPVNNKQAPGGVELVEPCIRVVSAADQPPPFDLFRPSIQAQLPTVLDHAPIGLRHPAVRARFRLAAATTAAYRTALNSIGFVEIFTPKIVETATEGGANVFEIDYFGSPAFLAQSPQFYKQMMTGVFERVFEIGPVFRAEPHDTPRHLNQYTSLDFEVAFVDDHQSVMVILESVIAEMLVALESLPVADAALLELTPPKLSRPIPSISFREAQDLIARETGENLTGEPDLAPSHERWLGRWANAEWDSDFLFVTGYPMARRPFYTHPTPGDTESSNSFDLLFRGLEVVTGGQRLHRFSDYQAAITERGVDPVTLGGYLETFKHGMPPHGGCALGLERWVARLLGLRNVRETTLFPRDINRRSP